MTKGSSMAATRNRMAVAEKEFPERLPAQLVRDSTPPSASIVPVPSTPRGSSCRGPSPQAPRRGSCAAPSSSWSPRCRWSSASRTSPVSRTSRHRAQGQPRWLRDQVPNVRGTRHAGRRRPRAAYLVRPDRRGPPVGRAMGQDNPTSPHVWTHEGAVQRPLSEGLATNGLVKRLF
jgi:hypothetical protein